MKLYRYDDHSAVTPAHMLYTNSDNNNADDGDYDNDNSNK